MKDKKKTIAWGILILVIIVALVVNSYLRRSKNAENPGQPLATAEEANIAKSNIKAKNTVEVQEHDYMRALALYKDKRVQFSENCTATPARSVYRQGEKIMIDNRSSQIKGITLGHQVVTVGSYDYVILDLYEKGDFGVDCGSLSNAATVIVQ